MSCGSRTAVPLTPLTARLGGLVSGIDGAGRRCRRAVNLQNQYLNPWLLMGSFFIPVIPTHSANLAGTASILTNWWVGQGVETFGFTGVASNLYKLNNRNFGLFLDLRSPAAEKIRRHGRRPVLLQQPVVLQRRLWHQQGLWRVPGPVQLACGLISRASMVWSGASSVITPKRSSR